MHTTYSMLNSKGYDVAPDGRSAVVTYYHNVSGMLDLIPDMSAGTVRITSAASYLEDFTHTYHF